MSATHTDNLSAARALELLDLTSLGDTDTDSDIINLCQAAVTPFGRVAAVCVWPRFVETARSALNSTGVKVATVANFPAGSAAIDHVAREVEHCVTLGADEVDVVYPWQRHLDGDRRYGRQLLQGCRKACGSRTLKIILETGELSHEDLIREISESAIEAGADFLKTSTGKTAVSATPQAARIMLSAIRDSGKACGFKASGGISSVRDASAYLKLADNIMGANWVSPQTFRFGASSLLGALLEVLTRSAGINRD